MKAHMTDKGVIVVEPESGVEAFALGQWAKRVDWNTVDACGVQLVVSVRYVEPEQSKPS